MHKKSKSPKYSPKKFESELPKPATPIGQSESFSFSPEKDQKTVLSLAEILTSVSKLNTNTSKPLNKTLTSLYDKAKDIALKKEQKCKAIFNQSHPFRPTLNRLSEKMMKKAKLNGIDPRHYKTNKRTLPQPSPVEDPKEPKHISMTQFVEKYNAQVMRYRQKPKGEPFVEILDLLDENCTFSPKFDRKSMELMKNSEVGLYCKAVRDREEKWKRVEKIKRMREEGEMAECSFSPKIIRNYSRSPRPSFEVREARTRRGYSRNAKSANRSHFNISYVEGSDLEY